VQLIPRTFHWVWLGESPLPDACRTWIDGWLELHPGWSHRIWSDDNRPTLVNEAAFVAVEVPAQRADILRYEVVMRYGGAYLDTDFECLRNIEELLDGVSAFAGEEEPGQLANGIFGAVPGHPWVEDLVRRLPASLDEYATVAEATGPGLITRVTPDHPEVTTFPAGIFYPYRAHEPSRAGGPFPDAFAAHRWAGSWVAPEDRFLEDFPKEIERELCGLIPASGRVVTIAEGIDLDLGPRAVLPFVGREGSWANPDDSAAALAELGALEVEGYDWLVVLELASWWFDYYADFFAAANRRARAVHRRRHFTAYAL
jgi:glycosyl transferase-like sugar-binding protein